MFSFFSPTGAPPEEIETLLRDAVRGCQPAPDVQKRLRTRMLRQIEVPRALLQAKQSLPADVAHSRIRSVVLSRIALPSAALWDRLRQTLTPSVMIRDAVLQRLMPRLQPVAVPSFAFRFARVAVAFVLVLVVVRVSPSLFIAPQSRADSSVLLVPGQGEVSILLGGLWQPVTGEVALRQSAVIRTAPSASATLIMHDDGVLRFGSDTVVALHDLSDRPRAEAAPTFSLQRGTLWVQALVPEAVGPGWTVATPRGTVSINEGSVSVTAGDEVDDVAVWDRAAQVEEPGRTLTLVSGEGVRLGAVPSNIRKMTAREETSAWVSDNLDRDAVRRKEIAVLQQQRRARSAGILPGSSFYPVKRVAEAVDVLLTFGQEAKVQKLLDHANTRLNEAAALLASGTGTDAAQKPLDEYRQTLLAVGSGSGELTKLVNDRVAQEVADSTAALPDDQAYLLKKTVLETSAELPDSGVKPEDVQGTMLVDTLVALTRQAEEGGVGDALATFQTLLPQLDMVSDTASSLSPEMRKEAKAALAVFAQTVEDNGLPTGTGAVALGADVSRYLLTRKQIASLTDEQVELLVQQMCSRIFLYRQPISRYNQLLVEFRSIESSPDRGRILRRLYHALPENGLARYVRTEFQKVREQVALGE